MCADVFVQVSGARIGAVGRERLGLAPNCYQNCYRSRTSPPHLRCGCGQRAPLVQLRPTCEM